MARGEYDTSGVKKPIGPNPPPSQPPSSETKAIRIGRGPRGTSHAPKGMVIMGRGGYDTTGIIKPPWPRAGT
jgi:hypothetical protein